MVRKPFINWDILYCNRILITNGMILQWGSFTGGNSISVTFPVAFSSACRGISFATTRASDASRLAGTHLNSAPSTTKFVASSINTNGGGSGVIKTNVRWIAMGY